MSHVHFGEVKDKAVIEVKEENEGSFRINLGFLQDQHVYMVHVDLPVSLPSVNNIQITPIEGDGEVANVSTFQKDNATELRFELRLAGVHGPIANRVKLLQPAIEIFIKANVLKSHDGTPSLKKGIAIIARLDNDDASSIASGTETMTVA